MSDIFHAVSIVVPVLNGGKTIESCLKSLMSMDYPSDKIEIIVVDNGSKDNTAELVSKYPVVCVNEQRTGSSYARNTGIDHSVNNYIAFIDVDCVASRGMIRELMKSFDNEDVGVSVGEVVTYPSKNQVENYTAIRKSKWQSRNMAYPKSPWFLSNCVVIKREVFEEVGHYDPQFSGMGCEDIDFSWRFFNKGKYKSEYQPRAVLFHRHRSTFWGLFYQYYRYGKGQYMLSLKHPGIISWNLSKETSAYKDLFLSVLGLLKNTQGVLPKKTIMNSFYYNYYDLVRKIAERIGFTIAFLRRHLR